MTSAKIIAEQIGMLVIANAEQAAQIEQLRRQIQALQANQTQHPEPRPVIDESGFGAGAG